MTDSQPGTQDVIRLSSPHTTPLETEFVTRALESGWVAPLGPEVDAFEREMSQRLGVQHALALNSGTAALHLAALLAGARPGRLVLLPTMTFAATVNAVLYTGATPVFVDSDPHDANIDVGLLEKAIGSLSTNSDIAAIIAVDLFGRVASYDQLTALSRRTGVPVIEDAAEALGSQDARGRPAGSFGSAAALSFNGNKIMTTSGGGMLLSNDGEFIQHARKLSTQAREPVPWYEHREIGYNYRLSNILAALGRAQLLRLDSMIKRRREIRHYYQDILSHVPGVRLLGGDDFRNDNCWLTAIILPDHVQIDRLVSRLAAANIEARHLWKPLHLQAAYSSYPRYITGVSEELFRHGIVLPSGSNLSDSQVDRVAQEVLDLLQSAGFGAGPAQPSR